MVGTSSTAICAPLRASKSASFCSSSACCAGGQRAGQIGDARLELRDRLQRLRGGDAERGAERGGEQQRRRSHQQAHRRFPDVARDALRRA